MRTNFIGLLTGTVLTLGLAGCAGNNAGLTTASVNKPEKRIATPAPNPACLVLSNQIAQARSEGTAGRVHAAAAGKTKVVRIKRESLAKAAELDKLNQEFQAKCSTIPAQQSAAVTQPVVRPPGAVTNQKPKAN